MARQKITAESRLRTENTLLREQLRGTYQACDDLRESWTTTLEELSRVRNDLASRDASIAELHHQLAISERERTLAEERLGDYLSAVQVQARLLGEAAAASERLRYPEPKR